MKIINQYEWTVTHSKIKFKLLIAYINSKIIS